MQNLLPIAFALYALSLVLGMAPMSIFGVLLLTVILVSMGPMEVLGLARRWWSDSIWYRRYFFAVLFFFFAVFTSLLAAKFWPFSYCDTQPPVARLKSGLHLWYFILPLVWAPALGSLNHVQRTMIMRTWMVGFGLVSLLAIQQFFSGWPRMRGIPHLPGFYHATGLMGHHLSFSNVWIFGLFVSLELLFSKNQQVLSRRWLWMIFPVGLLALTLTYSRMLLIALPFGLFAWVLLYRKQIKILKWGTLAFVLISFVAIQAVDFKSFRKKHWSLNSRVELWKANWEFFKRRPLTGTGYRLNPTHGGHYLLEKRVNWAAGKDGEKTRLKLEGVETPGAICQAYKKQACENHKWVCGKHIFTGHAHNNVMEALGGMGLLGFLAWIIWSGLVFVMAWKVYLSGQFVSLGLAASLPAIWITFHLNGMTQVNFGESKIMHQMAWMAGWGLYAVSSLVEKRESN